ncbi:MAG: acyl-CoA dehydrogenase family protein, partial [Prochlorotrichaceae cyanobacterium]
MPAPPPPLVPDFSFLTVTPEMMEQDPLALRQGLASLGDRHLLTLKVPEEWGGKGLTTAEYFQFQMALTRQSGTLAFTQTQHQSAASFIVEGNNPELKSKYLAGMATGQHRMGIGFSHLRRSGEPSLRATPSDRGYCLNGVIPWLTGWGLFQDAVIAATLPEGGSVWGIIPLVETPHCKPSPPMALAAMPATQTVAIALENYELQPEQILNTHPPHWLQHQDQQGLLKATAFCLGSAQSSLDLVQAAATHHPELQPAAAALQHQWQRCYQHIQIALSPEAPEASSLADRLKLRGSAIALAGRCAQAAVAVSRGAANHLSHRSQRIYREMLVFTVSGQSLPILQATLEGIVQMGAEGNGYQRSGSKTPSFQDGFML